MLEILEHRVLFVGAPLIVDQIGGNLIVHGNGYDVLVTRNANGVFVTEGNLGEWYGTHGPYTGVSSLEIYGSDHDDLIDSRAVPIPTRVYAYGDDDVIITGNASDTVDGGLGSDTVDGRGGFNVMSYTNRTENINGAIETRPLVPAASSYVGAYTSGWADLGAEHDTFENMHQINGGSGNDTLRGDVGDYDDAVDYLGKTFTLVMSGGAGNDTLSVRGFHDVDSSAKGRFAPLVYGGTGNDKLTYNGLSHASLFGQNGNDTLFVGAEDYLWIDEADGGAGTDLQNVHVFSDMASMYAGILAPNFENAEVYNSAIEFHGNGLNNNIKVFGGYADAYGSGGNDTITLTGTVTRHAYGEAGNDTIYGSDANDFLVGGGGNDRLFGNNGNDWLWADTGDDSLDGGNGNDSLYGNDGKDTLVGGYGNDRLDGGAQVDYFYGGPGADLIYARDGSLDFLFGGDGTDKAQRDAAEQIVDSIEVTLP